jgi:hypothetical protein
MTKEYFKSLMRQSEPMKNRYGDEYYFKEIFENVFQFYMSGDSMQYCRFGGRDGQESLDPSNLGMFDPSGGPYISIGGRLFGQEIVHIKSVRTGQDQSTFIITVE